MKQILLTSIIAAAITAHAQPGDGWIPGDNSDELQRTYDLLRSKLSSSEKQTLKQLELKWIARQQTLTGPASVQSELNQIEFLQHWLGLISPESVAQVRRAAAEPVPASSPGSTRYDTFATPQPTQSPVVAKATPVQKPQATVTSADIQAPKGQIGTCVVRKGALIASSPEIRKRAFDYLFQKDEASFMQLVESGDVVVLKSDTVAYWDGPENGLDKIHFKGGGDIPYYADYSDVEIAMPK